MVTRELLAVRILAKWAAGAQPQAKVCTVTFRLGGYGIDYTGDPDVYAREHAAFGYNAAYMPNISLDKREGDRRHREGHG